MMISPHRPADCTSSTRSVLCVGKSGVHSCEPKWQRPCVLHSCPSFKLGGGGDAVQPRQMARASGVHSAGKNI